MMPIKTLISFQMEFYPHKLSISRHIVWTCLVCREGKFQNPHNVSTIGDSLGI